VIARLSAAPGRPLMLVKAAGRSRWSMDSSTSRVQRLVAPMRNFPVRMSGASSARSGIAQFLHSTYNAPPFRTSETRYFEDGSVLPALDSYNDP
jgi:hypothetical protein